MQGLNTAFEEVTLVLFTTLAPSGALALLIMAVVLLMGKLDESARKRINQFLCIPLVISMVGLVASATHLGNPANALYVFLGVGRSPLSTEVFCAVIFLFFAGIYWLYSFTERPFVWLQKIWLVVISVSAIAFITSIAFAYSYETIISWNNVYAPLNLWFNALVGGPILALFSLQVARYGRVSHLGGFLCGLSGVFLVANTVSYVLQNAGLSSIENSLGTAADLVPQYSLFIALFVLLSLIGIGLYALSLIKKKLPPISVGIVACISVLLGIFIMRFAFYMMHMTYGV